MRHRFGRLAAIVVLTGTLCAVSASRFAQPASAYGPHPQCVILLNHTTLPVHGVVTVTVTCTANTTFVVVIGGVTLGSITTNADGTGSGTFTIPASLAAGSYVVTASDPAGETFSTGLTLTSTTSSSPSPTTTSGPLPFTGADVATTAGIGAVAIGGGGLIVLGARRRRRSRYSASKA
jgi:hypothetical protein